MTTTSPQPTSVSAVARLRPGDLAGLASIGLRTRKLRAALSALGIAIGVAAIVAVLGLAASAKAALLAEIASLGTNLLTVTNGQTLTGGTAELRQAAPGMIRRLPGVTAVQATGTVGGVSVYKSPYIPTVETSALSVDAVTLGLPAVAGTSLAQGRFLNAATAREPVAVLGAATAQRLGIDRIRPGLRIWAGRTWFYVTGILNKDTTLPGSTRRSWSGSRRPRNTCTSTATPRRSTSAPPAVRPPPRGWTVCSARRPARRTPARSTSPSPRTR